MQREGRRGTNSMCKDRDMSCLQPQATCKWRSNTTWSQWAGTHHKERAKSDITSLPQIPSHSHAFLTILNGSYLLPTKRLHQFLSCQICLAFLSGAGKIRGKKTYTWWASLTSECTKLVKKEEDAYSRTCCSLAYKCLAQETQGEQETLPLSFDKKNLRSSFETGTVDCDYKNFQADFC